MRALTLALALSAVAVGTPAAAATLKFNAFMDGPSESPPVASPGTGLAEVYWDESAFTMRVVVSFQDLVAPTTVAHIHSATAAPGTGTAPVATTTPSFPGFPTGVTFGSYDSTFDMNLASSYRAGFITDHGGTPHAAGEFLLASLQGGTAYFNVHSSFAPGGEIRGFFAQVPEPATWALMIAGFGLAGTALRSRRRAAIA